MTLTAVDEFARRHEADELPANAHNYRALIPLTAPGPGEQYGFDVDLDACTGCKSCVVACHSLNGLDEDESWRSVGTLQGGGKLAFHQTVTSACHHCVDPACLKGCPVDAYEKDPVTGIVAHLDDQCIGCSYCTLTCPYEVPRFNADRGIVRKCDMCRGRLAEGEAPACVQACPNGAISITLVRTDAMRATSQVPGTALVPGAPSSALTVPTTVYRTKREIPADVRAADELSLRPAHGHTPLAVMLVLTQLAVGVLIVDLVLGRTLDGADALGASGSVLAAGAGILALLASTLHLGRPLYAFRAVLGVGHSWLSREIVAFGGFAALSTGYAVAAAAMGRDHQIALGLGFTAALVGVVGVACSVALYAVTKRTWWQMRRSALTFSLSGAASACGACAAWLVIMLVVRPELAASGVGAVRALSWCAVAFAVVKLVREVSVFGHLRSAELTDLRRAALLLRRDLLPWVQLRHLVGALGGVALPAIVAASMTSASVVAASWALTAAAVLWLGGEMIERIHFFRVAVAPRMPGELR